MRDGFDCSELMDFAERLGAQPKEMLKAKKKMLRTSGTKLRRKTAQRARAEVGRVAVHRPKYDRKAGDYHRSIKRGKLNKEGDALRIRVYSPDRISHLIEDGWTPKFRDDSRGSPQAGKKVFADAAKEFEPEFESAVEDMVDELVKKI